MSSWNTGSKGFGNMMKPAETCGRSTKTWQHGLLQEPLGRKVARATGTHQRGCGILGYKMGPPR